MAASVPEMMSVPPEKAPVSVSKPAESIEPLSSIAVEGETQAVDESEWRIAVAAALEPEISPDSAGRLLAAGADDVSCQLPATRGIVWVTLPWSAQPNVGIRRRAEAKTQRSTKGGEKS